MRLRKFLNRVSTKIALIVTALVVVLFVFFAIVVANRGEKAFTDVYHIFTDRAVPPERIPLMAPSPAPYFPFRRIVVGRELTPREHFQTRFQSSLALIGATALLGAVGIGLLASRIIARPLNKLSEGMKKLRQSHYQERLEENDSEEFNALTQEFNNLAVELQRVEELRKNLISDTSHELKTPLASLSAQLEGIEDGVLKLDKQRLALLREPVDRLTEMVEGLQEYARLRSQALKLNLQKVRLKEMINKLEKQYTDKLAQKNIKVVLNLPDDYSLTADPKLLEQLFTNLFDNAIRYSRAREINIAADQSRLTFADDGVGAPKQYLNDIFERFFRVEKSRSRQTGGLGLGLAIVKEIIEAHGWKIQARIPEGGKGLEFVIMT